MRVVILTLGTRGDVQPYVALGLGLRAAGYTVAVGATNEFEDFVTLRGLNFVPLGFGFQEMMATDTARSAVESGNNTLDALRKLLQTARPYIRMLLNVLWAASQEADVLIFSTATLYAGYHIAEKLNRPVFFANPFMPPTRTMANPVAPFRLPWSNGWYNLATHYLVQQTFWQLSRAGFRAWREETLGLPPCPARQSPYHLPNGDPIPIIYGNSPTILPKPPDWSDHMHLAGYWFLDHPADWHPPAGLVDFLAIGPPPVYVGFGSMATRDPEQTTNIVVEALLRAKQRGVIAVGWGGISAADLPDAIFKLDVCPHDWLFPQTSVVVHHGGAGTTAAGLRAGVPSIVVPHFADQPFWAERVKIAGVGPEPIPRKELTVEKLAYAIRVAVTHKPMQARAAALGEKIRAEDGVGNAVRLIEHYLNKDHYA